MASNVASFKLASFTVAPEESSGTFPPPVFRGTVGRPRRVCPPLGWGEEPPASKSTTWLEELPSFFKTFEGLTTSPSSLNLIVLLMFLGQVSGDQYALLV
ncbi:hypothetical protein A2U01_0056458 [Trifolium medium]|uniref:Uncharacterized protein n=1 Tax=Trifolium medium TaxID=97028 RepID=A0A392RG97_9FABA|nr:hypothetical protein [Trifolium medium]